MRGLKQPNPVPTSQSPCWRTGCHDVRVTTSPITGFSHVQLLVTDVGASEQWYCTVLGLDRLAADEAIGYVALRHKPSGVVIVLSRQNAATGRESVLDHL